MKGGTDQFKKMHTKIIGSHIFSLFLVGLGVMMIMNPELGGYEPRGRHYLIKNAMQTGSMGQNEL